MSPADQTSEKLTRKGHSFSEISRVSSQLWHSDQLADFTAVLYGIVDTVIQWRRNKVNTVKKQDLETGFHLKAVSTGRCPKLELLWNSETVETMNLFLMFEYS